MEPLKTIAEAAAYLNIPESTLAALVSARRVPFTRPAGTKHIRFAPEHLAEIVAMGEEHVAPVPTRLQVVARTHPPSGPSTPTPPPGPKKPGRVA